jgi:hypothetical protein
MGGFGEAVRLKLKRAKKLKLAVREDVGRALTPRGRARRRKGSSGIGIPAPLYRGDDRAEYRIAGFRNP